MGSCPGSRVPLKCFDGSHTQFFTSLFKLPLTCCICQELNDIIGQKAICNPKRPISKTALSAIARRTIKSQWLHTREFYLTCGKSGGFPGGASGKGCACQCQWSLGQEDPLEEGLAAHSSSCLENPMDRGAWWATVQGVKKSWTELKQRRTHTRSFWEKWVLGTLPATKQSPGGVSVAWNHCQSWSEHHVTGLRTSPGGQVAQE